MIVKTYKVEDIIGYFGLFIDDVVEAENKGEAIESVMYEIMDNIGNCIDIVLEEVESIDDEK